VPPGPPAREDQPESLRIPLENGNNADVDANWDVDVNWQ
jgi:hypothetical protein